MTLLCLGKRYIYNLVVINLTCMSLLFCLLHGTYNVLLHRFITLFIVINCMFDLLLYIFVNYLLQYFYLSNISIVIVLCRYTYISVNF